MYQNVRARINANAKRQKKLYDWKAHKEMLEAGNLEWLHSPAVPRVDIKEFDNVVEDHCYIVIMGTKNL